MNKSPNKKETLNRCLCGIGMGLYNFRPLPKPADLIALLKEHHVQALTFWIKDQDGQFNTPEFREFAAALRAADIVPVLIMAYGVFWGSPHGTINRWAVEHPDWLVVSDKPSVQRVRYLCVNSPFRQVFLNWVREIIRDNDLGGIIFDEFHWANCRCANCQKLYREETGRDIPAVNFDDPDFRAYAQWCYQSRTRVIKEVADTVRAAEPGLPVGWLPYLRRGWEEGYRIAEFGPLVDGITHDIVEYLKRSQYARIYRSCATALRPSLWTSDISNFGGDMYRGKLFIGTREAPLPYAQFLAETLGAIANGCTVSCDVYRHDERRLPRREEFLDNYRRANAEILRRAPWIEPDERSLATVALAYSQRTHDYYDRVGVKPADNWSNNNYIKEYTGVYRALMESQVLFDSLPDEYLTDARLARYAALVLPSNVCLSDAEISAVDRFVTAGGGLVATYRTGLMDETGAVRPRPALAALLGAAYRREGNPDYDLLDRYRDVNQPKLQPSKGTFLVMQADFGIGRSGPFPKGAPHFCLDVPFIHTELGPDTELKGILHEGEDTQFESRGIVFTGETSPGVLISRHGRGRVVFLPFCVGTLYNYHRQIWAKELLNAAVRWAHAGERFPIEIHSPPQCEVNAYWQAKRNRLVIHFNNYQGFLLDGWVSRSGSLSPNVEYVPPLVDLKFAVDLAERGKPQAVYLAPERRDLAWQWDESARRLTAAIPRIDAHGMAVIEYG